MTNLADIAFGLAAAKERAEVSSDQLKKMVNGPEGVMIPTDSGPVPTIKEFLRQAKQEINDVVQQDVGELSQAIAQVDQARTDTGVYKEQTQALATQAAEVVQEGFNAFGDATDPDKGAAMVGTIRRRPGAVGRRLSDTLEDIAVTPYDFGAVGDGVHDDRSAFVAMNEAGGRIFIPRPSVSWSFSAPLVLGNVTVEVDPSATWKQLTGNGMLAWKRGNISTATRNRLADRVFIGDAASKFAGSSASGDEGTEWYADTQNHAGYLAINAQVLATGGNLYKYVGATRASDHTAGSMIFGGVVESDVAGRVNWGGIIEIERTAGMVYGWEVSAKNKGADTRMTPNTKPQGVYGLWLASGGDNAFGGPATAPSTAAVVILKNDDQAWNSGIVFQWDALANGEAIALSSEGSGGAHRLQWFNAAGNSVFSVSSNATDAVGWEARRSNAGFEIRRAGKTMLVVGSLEGAVNGLNLYPGAMGSGPQVSAFGDDADIDLRLTPKGAGLIRFGQHASSTDVAITGYIQIKDSTGAIRKLAVIT